MDFNDRYNITEAKLTVKNACFFYQLSKTFHNKPLRKRAFNFIKVWFELVCKTDNFLHLDYNLVVECLASPQLNITSELQVLKAAEAWIKYDINERCPFRSKILSKIRIHLLHNTTIYKLMNESSLFSSCPDCVKQLREDRNNKTSCNAVGMVSHRQCNRNSFNVIVCGRINWIGDHQSSLKVMKVSPEDMSKSKDIGNLSLLRVHGRSVVVGNMIYLLGGKNEKGESVPEIEAYSPETNSSKIIGTMPDGRRRFCACSFAGMIFVFGGTDFATSCKMFDPESKVWYKKTDMTDGRVDAACTVYKEKIVVSGGISHSNSVEAYDYVTNEWKRMPSMQQGRFEHDSVSVNDKLYVIGGWTKTCEVFDGLSGKFAFIKPICNSADYDVCVGSRVVAVGSEIIVFQRNKLSVMIYDVEKETWRESCCVTGSLDLFLCCMFPKHCS